MNEQLRESEEKFKSIVEGAFDAVVIVDTQGKVTYASPAVGRIFGYEPNKVIGKSFKDFLPDRENMVVSQAFASLLQGKSIDGMKVEAIRKDRTVGTIEINANPVIMDGETTHIKVIYRGITGHKQAEQSLKLSEENSRNSLNNYPVGIRIVCAEGKTLYANRALLDIKRLYAC